MKKIKEFFRNNIFTRIKIIISLIITAIFLFTVTLFLTGCWGEQNVFSDIEPKWSPDGTKITFVEPSYYKLESNWGVIWVMDTDGSNKIKLTNDTEKLNSPAWSPGGNKIAFVSLQNEDKINTFVMNTDGSNKVNLTGN
jgi:hypothetical protein